ncbi:Uu.00g002870.m01.CDS01 [Anthostomella pinea]|uniref:Uu.00g002870.m01.CDS01 n=1 Tax=Anthostomella pinea TaxID=933095 RepID=A0AAI8VK94_9PEZI|nr:Uu.00g002870.m01.CDS01 [Anthostomella pinea]
MSDDWLSQSMSEEFAEGGHERDDTPAPFDLLSEAVSEEVADVPILPSSKASSQEVAQAAGEDGVLGGDAPKAITLLAPIHQIKGAWKQAGKATDAIFDVESGGVRLVSFPGLEKWQVPLPTKNFDRARDITNCLRLVGGRLRCELVLGATNGSNWVKPTPTERGTQLLANPERIVDVAESLLRAYDFLCFWRSLVEETNKPHTLHVALDLYIDMKICSGILGNNGSDTMGAPTTKVVRSEHTTNPSSGHHRRGSSVETVKPVKQTKPVESTKPVDITKPIDTTPTVTAKATSGRTTSRVRITNEAGEPIDFTRLLTPGKSTTPTRAATDTATKVPSSTTPDTSSFPNHHRLASVSTVVLSNLRKEELVPSKVHDAEVPAEQAIINGVHAFPTPETAIKHLSDPSMRDAGFEVCASFLKQQLLSHHRDWVLSSDSKAARASWSIKETMNQFIEALHDKFSTLPHDSDDYYKPTPELEDWVFEVIIAVDKAKRRSGQRARANSQLEYALEGLEMDREAEQEREAKAAAEHQRQMEEQEAESAKSETAKSETEPQDHDRQ